MRRKERAEMRYVKRRTALIPSDVFGSYTGTPLNGQNEPPRDKTPVQDADDL